MMVQQEGDRGALERELLSKLPSSTYTPYMSLYYVEEGGDFDEELIIGYHPPNQHAFIQDLPCNKQLLRLIYSSVCVTLGGGSLMQNLNTQQNNSF